MICSICGKTMRLKKGDYHYVESGLNNVWLKGIDIFYCQGCGESAPKIHEVKGLHRAIARSLIEKTNLLTGAEIRFVRKEMGLRAVDLAGAMGVDKVTVSRWETGTERISPTSDRMIRLLYLLREEFGHETILHDLAQIRKQQQAKKLMIKPVPSRRETHEWAVA